MYNDSMSRLCLSLLGSFHATLDDQPLNAFTTGKVRALLAYLAVEAGRPQRREYLAGLLWPDQPEESALHNLRQALATLRKLLRDEQTAQPFLKIERSDICFDPLSSHTLDVQDFRGHMSSALHGCQPNCQNGRANIYRLRQALALYRGPLLDQFSLNDSNLFNEWAMLLREELNGQAIEGLTLLIEYHERRGEYTLARQAATRLVAIAPWDENAHVQLMRLYALDGLWSAAQNQYHVCLRFLNETLGVPPAAATQALFENIRRHTGSDEPLPRRFPPAIHNLLPAPTPFIGRQGELNDLAIMIADPACRLITLLGPGGMGKSRLALETARQQVGLFPDGVFYVPLGAHDSREPLAPAIAEAMSYTFSRRQNPTDQLLAYLQDKSLLLVLDNFEHLLEQNELLSNILRNSPNIVLLVTSRLRLNLREEWIYVLSGLPYPEADGLFPQEIHANSAVALFIETVRRLNRHFSPDAGEIASIIRICRFVAGAPLGIELAASATWQRTCAEIAAEVGQNLDVLTSSMTNMPDRQRSLRAAFEYSWQLLDPQLQIIFRRLSIFTGGFQPQSAYPICDATQTELNTLLDHSLLRRSIPGRYDLHKLLAQYSAEKLAADPLEQNEMRARHAAFYAAWLADAARRVNGPEQHHALEEIAVELENLRQAWEWGLAHDDLALIDGCLDGLFLFYDIRSRFDEGLALIQAAIPNAENRAEAEGLLARLLARQGALLARSSQKAAARQPLERSLEICERAGLPGESAFCQTYLANLERNAGQRAESMQHSQSALQRARACQDPFLTAWAQYQIGALLYDGGEIEAALTHLEESLTVARDSQNPRLIVIVLNTLADIRCYQGAFDQARNMFEECIAISESLGDEYHVSLYTNNLGTVYQSTGQMEQAGQCYRRSHDLCQKIGDVSGESYALSNLGEVALAQGDLETAEALYRQSLELARASHNQQAETINLNNLGEVLCARGDHAGAQHCLHEALLQASHDEYWTLVMKILTNTAGLLAAQGRPRSAVALLHLVQAHPASETDLQAKAGRLLAALPQPTAPLPSLALDDAVTALLYERWPEL